ncbi:cell filamentation protein Fic [Candidatus Bathyarchaeota archaeon]|jgi:Fic family protein|nr:cell filamentation protein Fic [Candidatus Bathyarchaeota archaeon]
MNETIDISSRQKAIINLLANGEKYTRKAITEKLSAILSASKPTVARDIKALVDKNLIQSAGSGPSTTYHTASHHPLLAYLDLDQYFALEPDHRTMARAVFQDSVFATIPNIITESDIKDLNKIHKSFKEATSKLDHTILARELERYVIELSWKSSQIEGNTYTILETESLIKEGREASGRTHLEAVMILNHKQAFKLILENKEQFRKLTKTDLVQLHNTLTKDLNVPSGIRNQRVGITGTSYIPLAHDWELDQAVERLITTINHIQHPIEKALATSALIAYIQPFSDGNKRTARMMANAVLLAHDYFPLSYRSVDKDEFKQALVVFYETNNIYHLKRIFLEQYEFAVNTYFL